MQNDMSWVRTIVPESLQKTTFILENWQWLGLFMIIMLSVILGRLANFLLAGFMKRWQAKMEERNISFIPDDAWKGAERPFGLLVSGTLAMLSLPLLLLPSAAGAMLMLAIKIFITCAGIWSACRVIDVAGAYFTHLASRTESKLDDLLVPMVRRSTKVFVVAFGLVFIAQNLNIEVASLLAGLGIGGLAFALAAKDLLANLFGSIMILVDQPFRIGDWVVVGDAEGTVEDVGFRYTRIRTFYNSLISLPNGIIVSQKVDNLGMRTYRRCSCKLSITYDTPPEKIEAFCEGIRELVRIHPYTRKDYFHVYLNTFADSSLDVLLYVFWETPDWSTELREKHRLFVDIIRLANRLGVEFAFPTQTLHLSSVPQGAGMTGDIGQMAAAITKKAMAGLGGESEPVRDGEPSPLLGSKDMTEALDRGRSTARGLVKSTLGEPAEVPPPVTF